MVGGAHPTNATTFDRTHCEGGSQSLNCSQSANQTDSATLGAQPCLCGINAIDNGDIGCYDGSNCP